MYQSLLTRRYLVSKVMPLLASLSVMLCTAMVLITWSVMGGFSRQLLSIGRTMIGDVTIAWPVVGIPYYDELIKQLEKDPKVAAATPTIEALGLIAIPPPAWASSVEPRTVQVIGIEPEGYDKVTGFYERLWWKHLETPLPRDKKGQDPRLAIPIGSSLEHDGRTLTKQSEKEGEPARPALVVGTQVTRYNDRDPAGYIVPPLGGMFAPSMELTLSVLPMSSKGVAISTADRRMPVANEFYTGLYETDANWVIAPIGVLQKMLKLDQAQKIDPATKNGTIVRDANGRETIQPPKVIGVEPARVTNILIKAADGVTPDQLSARVKQLYADFTSSDAKYREAMPPASRVLIFTWERKPGLETFIAQVKKETSVVLFVFSFISLTAVFLVLAIFWSMVAEKTKDIGILRAVGAGRLGVAWLWVRYGLIIGLVGSLLGGSLAWLVVANINPIHEWLGKHLGIVVWDPSVYYFTDIPASVDPLHATLVLSAGVLSCGLGAMVPALRAAYMDPVRALRFE